MPLKHFNANTMLEVFGVMVAFLRDNGIRRLVYKAIPHIYHKYPAEEDLYALFRHNARILVTNMSSAVALHHDIPFSKGAKCTVKLAEKNNVDVRESDRYDLFWQILSVNLKEKYNASPVHTLQEIQLLHTRFPDNIKLYIAYYLNMPVAGAVVYEGNGVAHSQYLSANTNGLNAGAMGYLLAYLIADYKTRHSFHFFDFGTSNENDGLYLNANLIDTKSGYGARGVAYNIYEMII